MSKQTNTQIAASHLDVSSDGLIHSTFSQLSPSDPLSYYLTVGLSFSRVVLASVLPIQILCSCTVSLVCASCPIYLVILDINIVIKFDYLKIMKVHIVRFFLQISDIFCPYVQIVSSAPCSQTPSPSICNTFIHKMIKFSGETRVCLSTCK